MRVLIGLSYIAVGLVLGSCSQNSGDPLVVTTSTIVRIESIKQVSLLSLTNRNAEIIVWVLSKEDAAAVESHRLDGDGKSGECTLSIIVLEDDSVLIDSVPVGDLKLRIEGVELGLFAFCTRGTQRTVREDEEAIVWYSVHTTTGEYVGQGVALPGNLGHIQSLLGPEDRAVVLVSRALE